MNTEKKEIHVLKDGPYRVTGNIPLNALRFVCNAKENPVSYEETKKFPQQEEYYLCRCGKSKNYPFCDGSHAEGFHGTETAGHKTYEEMAELIEGIDMDMLDAEELCAGVRFCHAKSGPWNLVTRSDNEQAKPIVEEICSNCASGRLTFVTKEGEIKEKDYPQEISMLYDSPAEVAGPIWVKGRIPIYDAEGMQYEARNRVTLCRCGKSHNKPFCDGSHFH